MANKTMTLQKAQAILAHKEDYDQDKIDEAQKFIDTNQSASVDMSIDKARAILDHKEDYDQDKIDQASAIVARYRKSSGKWIENYIPKDNGFNFNWSQGYNKPIKNDEDVQKLDDWRKSQIWDVEDKIDLRDVATEMGFKYPDEKWLDFLQSDRFPIFQNFLKDVQEAQKQKTVDEIWSGEEPSESYYPGLGTANVPLSNFAVGFMTPVAKEYARKNYENINGLSDMGVPLAFDVLTNAAMMGSGKLAQPFEKTLAKEFFGNASAPFISAVGNEVYNSDKDDDGLDHFANVIGNTAAGYGANKAAPIAINYAGNFFGRKSAAPTVKSVYDKATEALDDAVNQARKQAEVEAKSIIKEAPRVYKDYNKKITYTDDLAEKAVAEEEGFVVKDLKDLPTKNNVVERKDLVENVYKPKKSERNSKDIFKKSNSKHDPTAEPRTPNTNEPGGDLLAKMNYDDFQEAVDKLRSGKATAKDWQDNYEAMEQASKYLGLPTLESRRNWISQQLGLGLDYLANVPGSTPRSQKKFGRTMKALVPDEIYNFDDDDKKKKLEELKRIYGL